MRRGWREVRACGEHRECPVSITARVVTAALNHNIRLTCIPPVLRLTTPICCSPPRTQSPMRNQPFRRLHQPRTLVGPCDSTDIVDVGRSPDDHIARLSLHHTLVDEPLDGRKPAGEVRPHACQWRRCADRRVRGSRAGDTTGQCGRGGCGVLHAGKLGVGERELFLFSQLVFDRLETLSLGQRREEVFEVGLGLAV